MKAGFIVAIIAAFPPTLAAVLGYLANARSLRRAVGEPSIPLATVVDRIEQKLDRVHDRLSAIGERVARLEGPTGRRLEPVKRSRLPRQEGS